MNNPSRVLLPAFFLAFSAISVQAAQPTVEVLHWWGSGGEGRAARILETAFKKAGGRWIDVPVAGGGGGAAKVLQARFLSGNPPSVAMMHAGSAVWNWGEQSALAEIDAVGKAERWDGLLPEFVARTVKHKGRFVAAPTDVHRLNSLFVNTAILKKAGVVVTPGWPHDWNEYNAAAEKIRKAGFMPLAYGGASWHELMIFYSVVLGIGGPKFYQQALIDLDPAALSGPVMIKVFDQMRRLRDDSDKGRTGRGSGLTTAMVVRGEAAMQIMGDWALAEFIMSGKKPGKDFLCLTTPGSGRAFIAVIDAFTMFKVASPEHTAGQQLLASVLMSKDVQKDLNMLKGSTPPRLDVSRQDFDACTQKTMSDFRQASDRGELFYDTESSSDPATSGAIIDVVARHFHSDISSAEAAKLLAEAVKGAR